jgi:hypothetical protein
MFHRRPAAILGRLRLHLGRTDWERAGRAELDGALRDIAEAERRARAPRAELSESMVELRRTLRELRRRRGDGGLRKAAGLL